MPEQMRTESAPKARGAAPVADAPSAPAQSSTTTGALLAGRYRLHTRVGSDTAAGAEFWRAEDTVLRRDVALTVLRTRTPETGSPRDDDPTGAARADGMVVRALRSGSFEHGGSARLLDVVTTGMPVDVLGVAISEWVPGLSLAEVVNGGLIRPLAAAHAVAPLAAAVEAAHRHGLVLGCDHPQRVRITPDGRAQLCFALPRLDVTPGDDIRGLGAVLYTLLTSRWPLSGTDAARAGLAAADRTPDGSPVPPSRHRPGVPVELDALTRGTLGPERGPGQVRTAAAVRRLLSEVAAENDRLALFPPAHDGVPSAPGDVWQDRDRTATRPDPDRQRKLAIGLLALGTTVLLVLGYLGVQVSSMFSDGINPMIVVEGAPVGPSDRPPDEAPGRTGGVAAVAGVEVYDDVGDRDNADRVSRVIDGDRESGWRTSVYQQQFPALKPGVGIMVSFASAVQLAELTIDSPSQGTVIEVRSAPSVDADFDRTVPITEVTLGRGSTPVSLAASQPVSHVLLWIIRLGGNGGSDNVTEITELQFRRAGT